MLGAKAVKRMRDTGRDEVFSDVMVLLLAGVAAWCLVFLSGLF